jgi:hypothetical protein
MSRASSVRPSPAAAWLISLFAPENQAEPIQGDLAEEFSAIESASGTCAARRWYRKQSLKTSAHLAWSGLRSAPWLITFTTLAGFFTLWYTRSLPTHLVCGILDHYSGFYAAHFYGWSFCISYGIPVVRMIFALLVGCSIGLVAKGREVVATAAFGVFQLLEAPLFSTLLFLIEYHHRIPSDRAYIRVALADVYHYGGVGALLLTFISPFITVLVPAFGGFLVRKVRQTAAQRPLIA